MYNLEISSHTICPLEFVTLYLHFLSEFSDITAFWIESHVLITYIFV